MAEPKIGVLIATSLNRNEMLLNRSLASVLAQTRRPDCILIVDDNDDMAARGALESRLASLHIPNIVYVKNTHTHGMSGSGAWNTGLQWYRRYFAGNDYIAILDDDDRWHPTYLERCQNELESSPVLPDAVFSFLQRSDCKECSSFGTDDIRIESFLEGNPGIQGSNMFFRLGVLQYIKGFDETLATCTDRDILIRFLQSYPQKYIRIIPNVLVHHYAGKQSITYDAAKKSAGLTTFYIKWMRLYSATVLHASLCRAERLFGFAERQNIQNIYALMNDRRDEQKIIVGVALHNGAETIRRCLSSIRNQEGVQRSVWIIIADDDSTDGWVREVRDILQDGRIIVLHQGNHAVSSTRNAIHQFIRAYCSNVCLIGRLDADDEYACTDVLARIEALYERTRADAIFAGNKLRCNGRIISRVNRATRELSKRDYLLHRLLQMARGIPDAELPSCNTFMTPASLRDYPDIRSAEDHFVTVRLLLNSEGLRLAFAEDVLLQVYSLNGTATEQNQKANDYREARQLLYEEALELCRMKSAC